MVFGARRNVPDCSVTPVVWSYWELSVCTTCLMSACPPHGSFISKCMCCSVSGRGREQTFLFELFISIAPHEQGATHRASASHSECVFAARIASCRPCLACTPSHVSFHTLCHTHSTCEGPNQQRVYPFVYGRGTRPARARFWGRARWGNDPFLCGLFRHRARPVTFSLCLAFYWGTSMGF